MREIDKPCGEVYRDAGVLPREGSTAYDDRRVSRAEAAAARNTDESVEEATAELPSEEER